MNDTSAINWKSIFLEAFFVVLGVVLALGANNVRERLNNERRATTAIVSVLDEMASNQAIVAASIDYHSHLIDTLYKFNAAFGSDGDRYPPAEIFYKGIVNPARIVSRAWEATTTTGIIEFVPYDQVLLISQVYENQRQYESQSIAMASQIYARMYDDGMAGIIRNYKNILTILATFVYRECELARAYAQVLPQLATNNQTIEPPDFCQQMPKR